MRLAFVAKDPHFLKAVEPAFLLAGGIVSDQPEVVVVVGGDGTLLRAEAQYPGVPKALLKDSKIGNLYMEQSAEELAQALLTRSYAIEERLALEATVDGHTYRACNDVILRNARLTQAIRFVVSVNGSPVHGELVGDGLVIATPMGSTAYYYTITRERFTEGIGVAFNNIHTMPVAGPHVSANAVIEITIKRGPAQLGVDNHERILELDAGAVVRIKRGAVPLRIIRVRNA